MNVAAIDSLIPLYRTKGLLIDTNLLLLYVVGAFDPELIARFKRTRQFNIYNFLLLKEIVDFFLVVATTPHILSEVSNWLEQLKGESQQGVIADFVRRVQILREEYVPSLEIVQTEPFAKYGLADAAIIRSCKGKYLAITADFPLAQYMQSRHLDVSNFNNIRLLNWN